MAWVIGRPSWYRQAAPIAPPAITRRVFCMEQAPTGFLPPRKWLHVHSRIFEAFSSIAMQNDPGFGQHVSDSPTARTEERRVGKECVCTCRSRCEQKHKKINKKQKNEQSNTKKDR